MKNSNIDVDIIDETLLYICIDGKREHISHDNARIKYAKNTQVLTMIDDVIAKYKENSEPLKPGKEEVATTEPTPVVEDINSKPLEEPDFEIDLGEADSAKPEPSLKDLNDKPLEPVSTPAVHIEPVETKKKVELKDLNDAPLGIVNEAKFANIYEKYNSRIRETFPTDSPSFLDVEKLTRNSKPLEQTR